MTIIATLCIIYTVLDIALSLAVIFNPTLRARLATALRVL